METTSPVSYYYKKFRRSLPKGIGETGGMDDLRLRKKEWCWSSVQLDTVKR